MRLDRHLVVCTLAALALAAPACDSSGGGGGVPVGGDTAVGADVVGDIPLACVSTCDSPGAKQCDGNAVVTCGDHDNDGCTEWGKPVVCDPNVCADGACTLGCTSECSLSGEKRCEGNAVQTCKDYDANGCLEWGGTTDCLAGTVCASGFCSVGCEQDCTVQGARKCGDDGGYQVCTDSDFDGCLEWSASTACADGKVCSNGNCAAQCTDECTAQGARQCDGTNGYVTCDEHDGDGCLEWGGKVACGSGEVCSLGFCATDCTSECTVSGAAKCNGSAVQTCIDANADGCLEWGTAVPCDEGQTCAGGFCQQTCKDECTVKGASTCDGAGFKVCDDYDTNGCLEWGTVQACASGQTCSAGKCSATCDDECTVIGAKKCLGAAVQTCGNTDGDPCLEWGTAAPCEQGQSCSNGNCATTCKDDCTVKGAKACDGPGYKVCDDYDANGCLEWGTVQACDSGQTCSNGNCSTTCIDECTFSGSKKCSGNAVQACDDLDADPCLEWGTAVPCADGQTCVAGTCVLTCVDACTVKGARQCDGSAAYQLCDDYDDNGCLEWGTAVPCAGGEVCSNGNCALDCTDECPAVGAKQCNVAATAYQLCDDHDTDGCLEWGSEVGCGDGQVCSGGNCAATCSNECDVAGGTKCNAAGTGVQTCGDYNGDGCLQWGTAQPCGEAAVCDAGECQTLPAPGEVVINEVLYDDDGADDNAFVELYGEPGLDLTGFVLRGINGANNQPYNVIELNGSLDSGGFFVVATETSGAAILAAAAMTHPNADYQNGPDNVQLLWGDVVVDAVGYGNFAGASFAGEGAAAPDVAEAYSLGRDASGTDTDDNAADFVAYAQWTPGVANGAGNAPPTAVLACPDGGDAGEQLSFSAAGSTDPDGTIVAYAFDFGDGTTTSGTKDSATHTYDLAKSYTITLTVTDNVGATDTATCSLTLADPNAPKVTWIQPAADQVVTQGDSLNILVDVTPGPGKTIAYTELLVNGVVSGAQDDLVPYTHAYTVPSDYATGGKVTLQVRAKDDANATGVSPVRTLTVLNDPPVASFSAVITGNLKVSVDATGSSDTETAGADLEVRWDWDNDGTWDTAFSKTKTATHTYAADGEHTIGMEVRDAVGQVDSTTRTINFQSVLDVSGTISSTTWFGTINVTGTVTVPAGQTLTIASGTTVILVEVDQDGGGVGDYSLVVDGTLVVEGTEADPVIFTTLDTDGKSDASAWNRVQLKGGAGASHVIDHAIFEFGDINLEVAAAATISNTELRNGRIGMVVGSAAGNVTLTNVHAHDNVEDGLQLQGGTVTATNLKSIANGGRGVTVLSNHTHAVDGCTITGNGRDGWYLQNASVAIDLCLVSDNGGAGFDYRGSAAGSVTHSQIIDNGEEGVRAIVNAGNPTPKINWNNLSGNGLTGALTVATVNLVATTPYEYGSGYAQSALFQTPNGAPILAADCEYDETTSLGTIVGTIRNASSTDLLSFTSDASRTWRALSSSSSSVRAYVTDTYSGGGATMSIYRVAYIGPGDGRQISSLVNGGTLDARYNYVGTWPDVVSQLAYQSASHLDVSGFVGVPFGAAFDKGPYWGGLTLTGETTWEGQIWVTGKVTVGSGATLTVAPGAHVTFVPTDQDGDAMGDWWIDRGAGALTVAGGAASRVTFDVLGDVPAKGGYQGLHGTGAGTTTLDYADVLDASEGIRGSAGTVLVNQTTVTGSASHGVSIGGSASLTATYVAATANGGDGFYLTSSGALDLSWVTVDDNAAWGVRLVGAKNAANALEDAEINDNLAGGVKLENARAAVSESNIKRNGYGVWLHGAAQGSVSASNLLFNTREGVLSTVGPGGEPSASVTGNNIFGNTTEKLVGEETIAPQALTVAALNLVAATPYEYGSGYASSATWSAPNGSPVLAVRTSYDETTSLGTIVGSVRTGSNAVILSFASDATTLTWRDIEGSAATSVKAYVEDTYSGGGATMTVASAAYSATPAGGSNPVEMSVLRNGGTFVASGNYWGVFPDVASRVQEVVTGTVDYTGFKSSQIATAGPQQ